MLERKVKMTADKIKTYIVINANFLKSSVVTWKAHTRDGFSYFRQILSLCFQDGAFFAHCPP